MPIKLMTNGSRNKQGYGECLMIDKYGNCYLCIDNAFHPNPGTADDEYSEIERTVDWLVDNNIYPVFNYIDKWLSCRLSACMAAGDSIDDAVLNSMYCDTYDISDKLRSKIDIIWSTLQTNPEYRSKYEGTDDVAYAEHIADYLNEHFLRVRAGGKLNPEGTDTIYFRISSHGYDWRPIIFDFMWDNFTAVDNMPSYVWIGHDAETNPPEVTLFEGTPDELFSQYDDKVFATSLDHQTRYM